MNGTLIKNLLKISVSRKTFYIFQIFNRLQSLPSPDSNISTNQISIFDNVIRYLLLKNKSMKLNYQF